MRYEYALTITVKDAEAEEVLELIEKLRARVGQVVVHGGGREVRLLRALEEPKKVLTEYQEGKKQDRADVYRVKLEAALRTSKGSPQGAAKLLGLSPETVRRWVKRFGMEAQLSWRALKQ